MELARPGEDRQLRGAQRLAVADEWGNNTPDGEPAELESILLAPYPCGASPCIASIFGPTASSFETPFVSFYWSASTNTTSPRNAWLVLFSNGRVGYDSKFLDSNAYVRAVR